MQAEFNIPSELNQFRLGCSRERRASRASATRSQSASGEQFSEGFQIFSNFYESAFVFLFRERQLELVLFFFFGFFQFLARPIDGKTFGVKKPLDIEQQLDVAFFIEPMLRRRFGRLEQIEFGFPITQNVRLYADDFTYFADFEINFFRQTGRHCQRLFGCCRSRRGCRRGRSHAVQAFLHDLAGFKGQYLSTDDDDLIAGLRVSAFSRPFGIHDKIAKAGDFYFLTALQGAFDDVESGLDDVGSILFREADFLVDSRNDFCLRHMCTSSSRSNIRFSC
ncbi:MAG TPA: hypothetical protein VGQ55_09585, partial [Pyrinomonadaceae bacterium]|nr:hypothetical protein [Pyrinomonadaceae bacterium]